MTSRRDFLKKAGLLSAAFAVPSLNVNGDTPQSKMRLKNTKIAVDDRWDVIVIGGGPGGCTAAISAARWYGNCWDGSGMVSVFGW